jgi:uncharacterized membrane protein
LAVVLAVASLAVLIYFLHHAAASIHAPNVIGAAARELDLAIDRLYPADIGGPATDLAELPNAASGAEVTAQRAGYVQRIDGDALLEIAEREQVVVHVLCRPGDFVFEGERLLRASPAGAVSDAVTKHVGGAFLIGQHRTADQDIEFSFEQLVQIALRALSPAYNDPLTAAACIERLAAALHQLFQRREPASVRAGRDQQPRVVAEPLPIATIVDLALTPVAEAAVGSPIALRQLARSLASLAPGARTPGTRAAIAGVARVALQHARALSESPMGERIIADCHKALTATRPGVHTS